MEKEKRPNLFQKLKNDIVPLLKLNFIFLLLCIPVISIPSAIQAMTKVNLSLIEEKRTDVVRDFLEAFRDEFKDGLLCGVILAVLFLVFGYVAWFYQQVDAGNNLMTILVRYMTLFSVIVIYCASCYLWVINIKVEQSLFARFKNAFFLVFICIRPTLLCLLFGGLIGAIVVFGVPYSTPFIFVGAFSLWNYICSYYALPMVETFLLGISRSEDTIRGRIK